jgi:hypothetical protein
MWGCVWFPGIGSSDPIDPKQGANCIFQHTSKKVCPEPSLAKAHLFSTRHLNFPDRPDCNATCRSSAPGADAGHCGQLRLCGRARLQGRRLGSGLRYHCQMGRFFDCKSVLDSCVIAAHTQSFEIFCRWFSRMSWIIPCFLTPLIIHSLFFRHLSIGPFLPSQAPPPASIAPVCSCVRFAAANSRSRIWTSICASSCWIPSGANSGRRRCVYVCVCVCCDGCGGGVAERAERHESGIRHSDWDRDIDRNSDAVERMIIRPIGRILICLNQSSSTDPSRVSANDLPFPCFSNFLPNFSPKNIGKCVFFSILEFRPGGQARDDQLCRGGRNHAQPRAPGAPHARRCRYACVNE